MIRLITADAPDLVALQELPLWSLRSLERWSGMRARSARTMPALLGPLGRLAARFDPVRFRSAATGQANAILVNPHFTIGEERSLVLNPELSWRSWLFDWEHRRVCQSLEVQSPTGTIAVGNLHAAPSRDQVHAAAKLFEQAERCVLCGDFNLTRFALAGFSKPIEGLDQIFVRGLEFVEPPRAWLEDRRRVDGALLSDHTPVEAVIA